jgi:MFS family permease
MASTPFAGAGNSYGTDSAGPDQALLGHEHATTLHSYEVKPGAPAGVDYTDHKVQQRRLEQLGLGTHVIDRAPPFMCGPIRGFVLMCIMLTALTCILLGYDIGVLSGAKIYIKRDFDLKDNQVELLVGILNFVSSIGGLFSGRLSDRIGRKGTVALACVIFLLGAALMAFAKDYSMLMAGRVITGVGVGTGLTIAPLYMAELSPKKIRGALVSLNEVAINIGILLGFVAGYALSGLRVDLAWRLMLGLGAFPPIIILLSLLIMPESPRWLVRHGKPDRALMVLLKTCDITEAFETLAVLEDECLNTVEGTIMDIIRPGKTLGRLIIAGFGVTFFQQASGIEALVG